MRLQDKVTIITGAGGGMGRVAAELFAAEGARVVVAEYSEAAGQETVDLVTRAGGQATFVRADVSQEAEAKAMVDHALATYGRIDCLYNNAGIMPEKDHSVTDTDVDTWDAVMAVNVRGVYLGCKYAVLQFKAQNMVPSRGDDENGRGNEKGPPSITVLANGATCPAIASAMFLRCSIGQRFGFGVA